MVPISRKKAKFVKKVKYLVRDVLSNDFRVTRSVIRNRLSTDRVYLKFGNGYSIYGTVDVIKEELRFQIALNIFVAYEKAKRFVDIVDEPESCGDFENFKVLLYSSANFEEKLNRYFKRVLQKEVYEAGVKTRWPKRVVVPRSKCHLQFERDPNVWPTQFFRVQDRLANTLCRLTVEGSN